MDNYCKWSIVKRPAEELYRLESDPGCIANLAGDTVYTDLKNRLKTRMQTELKSLEDPRILGNGEVFDNYPYSGSDRNFYNRYINGEAKKGDLGWINKSDFAPKKPRNK